MANVRSNTRPSADRDTARGSRSCVYLYKGPGRPETCSVRPWAAHGCQPVSGLGHTPVFSFSVSVALRVNTHASKSLSRDLTRAHTRTHAREEREREKGGREKEGARQRAR